MSELKINKKLFQDRKRTNILSEPEQNLMSYLVPRIPNWMTSDGLTALPEMTSSAPYVTRLKLLASTEPSVFGSSASTPAVYRVTANTAANKHVNSPPRAITAPKLGCIWSLKVKQNKTTPKVVIRAMKLRYTYGESSEDTM